MTICYKIKELVGTSEHGFDDAIQNGVAEAAKECHHIDWFEVLESRGYVQGNKIAYYQAHLKIGYRDKK